MNKKNMFDKFIANSEEIEEDTSVLIDEPYDFDIPRSLLPWKNTPGKLNEYTALLVDAGFSNIDLIASATITELELKVDIPTYLLQELIDNAKKWTVFNFETAASLHQTKQLLHNLPTGCKALDDMLGGGVEPKSITEFYGEFISGKTQICLQLAAHTALPEELGGIGAKVLYIDTEGSFNTDRLVQISKRWDIDPIKILDNILVGRAYTTDLQMLMIDNIIKVNKEGDVKLVIIDSLTSNFRAEYIGKNALIDRQQKLNKHIQQLVRIAEVYDIAVVITNQVMMSMSKNELIPVGGNILAHGVTHRIHCRKIQGVKNVRQADLVASPSIPDRSIKFKITELGVENY